jgi:transposase InsO family protein
MKENLWLTLVTCLAYCVDKELWKAIEYLKEQARVLKEQQEKDKRILSNDQQRIRLAAKAKRLTRELPEATTVLFTPETVLGWYRKLIAQKYDGGENCKNPGRPKISQEIADLVIRFKKENPHWGYTRIRDYLVHLGYKIGETTVKNILLENGFDPEPALTRKTTWKEFLKSHWSVLAACDFFSVELLVRGKLIRCMVLFAIDVATRKVEILGLHTQPNGPWMEQIARNGSSEGGFLAGKKYLIHDRDPLYTAKFESILKAAGVEPVKLPPRSPNLNAHAERFVRSVKEECLDHLILSSENQLRYVLSEYLQYYHHERIHQGINKIIEPQHEGHQGEIICIERLGGLLKSYHRKAA